MNKGVFSLFLVLILAACSQENSASPAGTGSAAPAPASQNAAPAPAPAATPAPAVAAAPSDAPAAAGDDVGKKVFGKTCALCHGSGIAGAPKNGDKDAWAPRIAQGNEVLYKHAIEGFTGQHGMMPARGTGSSLTDDEVKAAVDFMVAQSR